MFRLVILSLVLLLSACTTSRIADDIEISPATTVALLPLVNHAQTPLAGERAEDILASIWQQNKLPKLLRAPRNSRPATFRRSIPFKQRNAMAQYSTS